MSTSDEVGAPVTAEPEPGQTAESPVLGAAGAPAPATPVGRVLRFLRARRVALGLAALGLLLLTGTGYDYRRVAPGVSTAEARPAGRELREISRLRAERLRLEAALRQRVPRGPWIVIDQTHNRLRLMRGETVVLEAPCSAGSGMVLKEASGGRVWVFDTPRGQFHVLSKIENPVWRRPDWAFVEEGEPIPKDPAERLEYGSLGEYALYFGNGYMIHGTLYERLLGRPVSHGCIRLGRDPLREVYRQASLGTPIYIY